MRNTKKKIALLVLAIMLFNITSFATNTVSEPKKYDGVEETLNLSGKFIASGCDAAIYAYNGAKLTINGNENTDVHGALCAGQSCGDLKCGFSTAVWAKDGSKITINGGNYTNDPDTVSGSDEDHVDLIYASNGSEIIITGGTFECATPRWTLNCKNYKAGEVEESTIRVMGGRYYKFDPSNTDVDDNGVVVEPGYVVVKDGDWYEVKKEYPNKKYDNKTAELNLDKEFIGSGCDAAIYAYNGANLTINGDDTTHVHAKLCEGRSCKDAKCGFSTAVWAKDGSKITINGGKYTNDPDTVSGSDEDHVDLIYASNGSEIVITGGIFNCATPRWTLNCKNYKPGEVEESTIKVMGGRYYKFDPSNPDVDDNGVVIAEGYEVLKDGDWYEVIPEHSNLRKVAGKEATYTEEGVKDYWVCNACAKSFLDEAATKELTNTEDLVIPKLVKIEDNNAIVDDKAVSDAIEEAKQADSDTVVLPLDTAGEDIKSATLNTDALNDIVDANKGLTIQTSEISTTLYSKTLEKILEEASNSQEVKIEVIEIEEKELNEKQKKALENQDVKSVISAQILANGKVISDFGGGKVKLSIPFTPEKGAKGSDYKMIYIDDNGKVSDVVTKFADGEIIVELEHFSEYAIVKVAANTNNNNNNNNTNNNSNGQTSNAPATSAPVNTTTSATTANPATGDGIMIYFIALAISIIGICTIVIIKAKRK